MAAANDKWAVVVIHGVGFTQPGETLERFFGVVSEQRNLQPVGTPEIKLLDHHDTARKRFPMYTRRAQAGDDQAALFAEVYWGDLSKSKSGVAHLLLRLLTIVFHLRYLVDCAAAYPYEGKIPTCKRVMFTCQRIVLWLASLILCGPIAAMYLLLFVFTTLQLGVAALDWLMATLFSPATATGERALAWFADYELCTFSIIAAIAGACLLGLSHARRLTWGGTWRFLLLLFTIGAIAIGCLALNRLLGSGAAIGVKDVVPECIWYASLGLLLTISLILLGIVLAVLLTVFYWSERAPISAAIGASMVQLALWSVIVPAVAMILFALPHGGDKSMLWDVRDLCLTNCFIALLPIGVLLLTGLYRLIRFRVFRSRTPGRLLVHWTSILALGIATIVGGVLYISEAIYAVAPASPFAMRSLLDIRHQISMHPSATPVTNALETPWVQLSIVLGAMVLVAVFLYFGRMPLHIVMDVISHFYRRFVWPIGRINHNSHTLQKRITHRVHRVLAEIRDEGVSRVTIVSHSQGTANAVIALGRADLDAETDQNENPVNLEARIRDWLKTVRVDLVTMGSPIYHLYQHYFPDRYPPFYVEKDGQLVWNPDWGDWRTGLVQSWTNLYRCDDFVGTKIVGDGDFPHTFPKNVELSDLGGHIEYWNSVDVIAKLDTVLPKTEVQNS